MVTQQCILRPAKRYRQDELLRARLQCAELLMQRMRPAKSSTQPRKARTWCALKFRWAPVLAF